MDAREALLKIGEILNDVEGYDPDLSRTELEKVWAVLSALRGPDSDDDYLKESTTAVIRRELFNEFGWPEELAAMLIVASSDVEFGFVEVPIPWHFRSHVKNAQRVLEQILGREL